MRREPEETQSLNAMCPHPPPRPPPATIVRLQHPSVRGRSLTNAGRGISARPLNPRQPGDSDMRTDGPVRPGWLFVRRFMFSGACDDWRRGGGEEGSACLCDRAIRTRETCADWQYGIVHQVLASEEQRKGRRCFRDSLNPSKDIFLNPVMNKLSVTFTARLTNWIKSQLASFHFSRHMFYDFPLVLLIVKVTFPPPKLEEATFEYKSRLLPDECVRNSCGCLPVDGWPCAPALLSVDNIVSGGRQTEGDLEAWSYPVPGDVFPGRRRVGVFLLWSLPSARSSCCERHIHPLSSGLTLHFSGTLVTPSWNSIKYLPDSFILLLFCFLASSSIGPVPRPAVGEPLIMIFPWIIKQLITFHTNIFRNHHKFFF